MAELTLDTVEATSAIGLTTDPGELAFLLVRRSITIAIFELIGEGPVAQFASTLDPTKLISGLDMSLEASEFTLDKTFMDRPAELPVVTTVKSMLLKWLKALGLEQASASAVASRFPSYFVYALNQEWRRNSKAYTPLLEALATPFAKAGEREWAWATYASLLQRRIQESVFDEPFGLSQIYVPLNAFYLRETDRPSSSTGRPDIRTNQREVVSLDQELGSWLQKPSQQDALRVISGGPGSGKSSFARIFAAQIAMEGKSKVLFVPLHLIDASKDLIEEVGRFVRDEGILIQNPLDSELPETDLLVIFDGLDELASQGKIAAETARAFVREVERTLERRNANSVRLRVLISGRELVVQENQSELRRPGQVLNILPYIVPKDELTNFGASEYHDPNDLLKVDLRQQWWKTYGSLTGQRYTGIPDELSGHDLEDVTAQPLLNYLVALSFSRGELDFSEDLNLNSVYADLVQAVYERGYEKNRPYGPIQHISRDEFFRVLEEIGMAAWHGDGRTTSVREIDEHCRASGLSKLLDAFQEGAKSGVTRLLAAFFFRQYGERPSGDPTFVFTHKSFGEYLTARRVVRAVEKMVKELEGRRRSPDEGWDDREALRHWVQICGPTATSSYLHKFLLSEMKLRGLTQAVACQKILSDLCNFMLQHGMPMERLQGIPFKRVMFESRNAEESLFVALNACARVTKATSKIEQPDSTTFGTWLRRIQGQRSGPESALALHCLSYLDISGARLDMADLYGAQFQFSSLKGVMAYCACLAYASLVGANLSGAQLHSADLTGASLEYANFEDVDFMEATLRNVSFEGANLMNASFMGANFGRTCFNGCNLVGARFGAARLNGLSFKGAHLEGADLAGSSFEGANLEGACLDDADLRRVSFNGANLRDTTLRNANTDGANLPHGI